MVGRLHNKARKEREWLELCGDTREKMRAAHEREEAKRAAFERLIDTPGSGYHRFECICGHKAVLHGPVEGLTFRCSRCGDAWQTVL